MAMRPVTRRAVISAGAIAVAGAAWGWRQTVKSRREAALAVLPSRTPVTEGQQPGMLYRRFGSTGLSVSEVGFGAWAIGGSSYGSVQQDEVLRALALAEELGCNLVDTAAVYGNSEQVLGTFLQNRRSRWVISTKYSGQKPGMTATLEEQLRRLGTDHVDFYMIHWVPGRSELNLYEELAALKKAGKVRFAGISLYSPRDVDLVLQRDVIDGVMLPMSLLDPDPFIARVGDLRSSGKGVIVRSALKEGFLVGKFNHDTRFTDPHDQRSSWSAERIAETVNRVEAFRFLEKETGSLLRAAVAYPLSFPEVSSVVLGAKNPLEAGENFRSIPGTRLSTENLQKIDRLQQKFGLHIRPGPLQLLRQLLRP